MGGTGAHDSLSARKFNDAIGYASKAESAFATRDTAMAADARRFRSLLVAAAPLVAEATGPARRTEGAVDSLRVSVIKLALADGAAAASRHSDSSPKLLLASRSMGPAARWSDANHNFEGEWVPPVPLRLFVCGPVCNCRVSDYEALREWVGDPPPNFDHIEPGIGYSSEAASVASGSGESKPGRAPEVPPAEWMLSCPVCNVRADIVGWALLGVQLMPVVTASQQPYALAPRCFCLRCVRDVVEPLARDTPAPDDGSVWAHQRPTRPAALPSIAGAWRSWLDEEGRRSALIRACREH